RTRFHALQDPARPAAGRRRQDPRRPPPPKAVSTDGPRKGVDNGGLATALLGARVARRYPPPLNPPPSRKRGHFYLAREGDISTFQLCLDRGRVLFLVTGTTSRL